jgi:hypothetical protein
MSENSNSETSTLEAQVQNLSEQVAMLREGLKPKLTRSSMTVQEKTVYIEQHGRDAYLALPWGEIKRSSFDALPLEDRTRFTRAGGSIVDDPTN